jgi:hypothetical protein
MLLPAAAPQEMQLFLATTADGQQLLLRAPAGTDPQSLIGADGSVQSCYLAAVLPNASAPAQQQQQQQHAAAASYVQQQQMMEQSVQQPQQYPPRRCAKQELHVDMPGGAYTSPSRVMSSPNGLLRFSPGKMVFSPNKGNSPAKPLLGNSPGKA